MAIMKSKKVKQLVRILFIEGSKDDTSGSLSQGFTKLFEKVLKGSMPRIIMGDGISTTSNKFVKNQRSKYAFLLIDSDGDETTLEQRRKDYSLTEKSEFVFFMIQEVEAWFISQPEIIDNYFGKGVSKTLPKKKPKDIEKPSLILQQATKNTKKGKYHKIAHCVDLLEMLDPVKLKDDFPQFKNLIKKVLEV
jgi:hypothetical protein